MERRVGTVGVLTVGLVLAGCGSRTGVGFAEDGTGAPEDEPPTLGNGSRPPGAPCDPREWDGPQLCYTGPPETRSIGECRTGLQTCEGGGWSTCAGEQHPEQEVCDLLDNDCDLLQDEGLTNECGSCELGCGLSTDCVGAGCAAFLLDPSDDGVFVRDDGALVLQADRASAEWSQVFSLGPETEAWGCLRWAYEIPDGTWLTVDLRTADRAESLDEAAWEGESAPTQRRAPLLEVRARFQSDLAGVSPALLDLRVLSYASCLP